MKFTKFLRTAIFIEQLQWLLPRLSRVFKGVQDKNRCDCLQYIPDLAEKGICCRENPEVAATVLFCKRRPTTLLKKKAPVL